MFGGFFDGDFLDVFEMAMLSFALDVELGGIVEDERGGVGDVTWHTTKERFDHEGGEIGNTREVARGSEEVSRITVKFAAVTQDAGGARSVHGEKIGGSSDRFFVERVRSDAISAADAEVEANHDRERVDEFLIFRSGECFAAGFVFELVTGSGSDT